MKISYNWLKQFLQTDWEVNKTSELLTDLGLEVEGVETIESIKGSLEGVVVGEVLTCVQHPNADRLKLTTVDLGSGDPVQIVCGAPNVAAGQKVPVATIGTMLYDDSGSGFKIKKGKIRGDLAYSNTGATLVNAQSGGLISPVAGKSYDLSGSSSTVITEIPEQLKLGGHYKLSRHIHLTKEFKGCYSKINL